ncbi:hypothetical protein BOSEA31B_14784 [Hyphomicrobiales bacterium]|nr:hypothetical protein BOSEA31B_14784 [Hyphomicrobiales bacterium]CAI0345237.1 hypothetical protein BO1005MUT1_380032 [Hyphomicrobiales bacterium]
MRSSEFAGSPYYIDEPAFFNNGIKECRKVCLTGE